MSDQAFNTTCTSCNYKNNPINTRLCLFCNKGIDTEKAILNKLIIDINAVYTTSGYKLGQDYKIDYIHITKSQIFSRYFTYSQANSFKYLGFDKWRVYSYQMPDNARWLRILLWKKN